MAKTDVRVARGVLLATPEGMRLVPLDGGRRLRALTATGRAAAALDLLHPDGMDGFLAGIRDAPRTTVCGEFVVMEDGDGLTLVDAGGLRRVTPEELASAIRFDVEQSLAELREAGIRPTMSAEELHELMRGGDHDHDHDGEAEPEAPAPGI